MERALGPAEIEQLVQQLYSPSNKPEEIDLLQSRLQEVQRNCSWDVPDKLLGSQDQNVRFFAALTFTVKINQHGSALEEEDLNALLAKLLFWFVTLVERHESLLVLRKICTTLGTFYILPNAQWRLCVRHVMCCLHARQAVDETAIINFPSTSELTGLLTPAARTAVLIFATILAEDAIRIDHNSQNFDYCHKRVQGNVPDVTVLMLHSFQILEADKSNPLLEVLHCYLSWFSYAGEEFSDTSEQQALLRTLLVPAMKCLDISSTFEPTAQFFIDLFTTRDIELSPSEVNGFHAFLSSNTAQKQFSSIESGDADDDSILIAQLALALGQCMSKKLMRAYDQYEFFMNLFHRLTAAQNFETIDQILSNAVVDFWESYISLAPAAESLTEEDKPIFAMATRHWLQALEELVSASALPIEDNGELIGLMNDDPFSEFRSRARMAIEGSYVEFEILVFEKLVNIAVQLDADIQNHRVRGEDAEKENSIKYAMGRLEFALFCIGGLSDSMEHAISLNSTENNLLERLFGSTIFSNLTPTNVHYSEKVRKRAICIIGEQERFFKSRNQQLMAALDLLFRALQLPGLHQVSALAIFRLSENNRGHLVPQIGQFLLAAQQLLALDSVDSLTKEYIVGAVGTIIQAHPVNTTWYTTLMQICNSIQTCMDSKLQQTVSSPSFTSDRQAYALEALAYLKALGKALQAPTHQAIVIDDDDDEEENGNARPIPQNHDALTQIQTSLARFMEIIIEPHRDDAALLVALCDVLKTGFRERQPGPFTFEPGVIATFITSTPFSNTGLDVAVAVGASFLTSSAAKRPGAQNAIIRITDFTRAIILSLEDPDSDPDLAHSCVEVLSCVSQAHLHLLTNMSPEQVSTFFLFAIRCLQGSHLPPKRSASQAWKTLFDSLRENETTRQFLQSLFDTMCPALTMALVHCFGGNAARSELNWLTEPFRKMVFTQPRAKTWIEQALFSTDFPSSRPSDADKRKFAAQVMQLRGDKRTQAVVRDFWLVCRGAPTAYG